ncbi:MAG: MFS transporter [Bacteroidetes bacterium]|nr:MFS transporter [Bacteroidota bacterium]
MIARTLSLYKNAYSGLSRSTWLLSLVLLVNRSGTMVMPFMAIYLTQPSMGYNIGQAGIVMGIFGFGAVCGGFLGGRLTDRYGFQWIQRIALIGGGFLFMLLGQVHSYPLICICTFLLSTVNEAFRPANSTAIAHYSKPENRTRSYSLNRLAVNLGWAVGGALGGILASINYHLLFWVDGGTNLLGVLLLIRFFPMERRTEHGHADSEAQEQSPALSPYRDVVYLRFITYLIIFACGFFQLFSTLPVFYKTTLHMPEYMIGLLMTMNGLIITFFEMVIVFKLEGKRDPLYYILYGVNLVGFSYILLNILPLSIPIAFFCMVLTTLGEITSMPFMNSFWISRTRPATRGQYAGLYTIAWSVAQVFGQAGGAQVAQYAGFRTLWWIVGGLCALSSVGFWYLRQHKTPVHE